MPRSKHTQNGDNGSGERQTRTPEQWSESVERAQLMLDGMDMRISRADTELNRLLGNHPDAERIRQLLNRQGDGLFASHAKRDAIERTLKIAQNGLAKAQAEEIARSDADQRALAQQQADDADQRHADAAPDMIRNGKAPVAA